MDQSESQIPKEFRIPENICASCEMISLVRYKKGDIIGTCQERQSDWYQNIVNAEHNCWCYKSISMKEYERVIEQIILLIELSGEEASIETIDKLVRRFEYEDTCEFN